jgi:hypothetical protein
VSPERAKIYTQTFHVVSTNARSSFLDPRIGRLEKRLAGLEAASAPSRRDRAQLARNGGSRGWTGRGLRVRPAALHLGDQRPAAPFSQMAEWGANDRIKLDAPICAPFVGSRENLELE